MTTSLSTESCACTVCAQDRELNSKPSLVYTECTGRTFFDGEHRGYITGFLKDGPHVVGAFAAIPPEYKSGEPVRMLHITLGRTVEPGLREIASTRFIDRDEFDRLATLDALRRDLGWRDA